MPTRLEEPRSLRTASYGCRYRLQTLEGIPGRIGRGCAERDMPGLTQRLLVAGAVAGADVEIAPAGDLNDETHLRRLARFVENNRHQMVFSISKPEESWVARLMKSFSRRVPWAGLAFQDADLAIEQFDASIENALYVAPTWLPAFRLGEWHASEPIEAYEGEAFQFSQLAKDPSDRTPIRMLSGCSNTSKGSPVRSPLARRRHRRRTLRRLGLGAIRVGYRTSRLKLDGSSWMVE